MATFKVGDKVRFVRGVRPAYQEVIGMEGSVAGLGELPGFGTGPWDCHVNFGGRQFAVNCMFAELEPILAPGFDAFMERVMQPIKEPVSA